MADFTQLPPGLPVPVDDGAADHLRGQRVPDLTLNVFCPIFPPNDHATGVLGWLQCNSASVS